jgi:hypothetical protein
VRPLGLVEPKPTGERVQDGFRDAFEVPALQAGVVVDAHAGEHRGLLAAKAEDASGVILARLEVRNSRISRRLSTTTTVRRRNGP